MNRERYRCIDVWMQLDSIGRAGYSIQTIIYSNWDISINGVICVLVIYGAAVFRLCARMQVIGSVLNILVTYIFYRIIILNINNCNAFHFEKFVALFST